MMLSWIKKYIRTEEVTPVACWGLLKKDGTIIANQEWGKEDAIVKWYQIPKKEDPRLILITFHLPDFPTEHQEELLP